MSSSLHPQTLNYSETNHTPNPLTSKLHIPKLEGQEEEFVKRRRIENGTKELMIEALLSGDHNLEIE